MTTSSAYQQRIDDVSIRITKDMLDLHFDTIRIIEQAEKTVAGYKGSIDSRLAASLRLNEQITAIRTAQEALLNGFELAQIKYAQLLDVEPQKEVKR